MPACDATSVQVPAATGVATVPLTVHTDGVVELKVTVSPEDAVADIVKVLFAGFGEVMAGKVMVCVARVICSVRSAVAAFQFAFPTCVARNVHGPSATGVTVVPLTVQVDGVSEEKVMGSPELLVADTANVALIGLSVTLNVMLCVPLVTVKVWSTGAAAFQFVFPAWTV